MATGLVKTADVLRAGSASLAAIRFAVWLNRPGDVLANSPADSAKAKLGHIWTVTWRGPAGWTAIVAGAKLAAAGEFPGHPDPALPPFPDGLQHQAGLWHAKIESSSFCVGFYDGPR